MKVALVYPEAYEIAHYGDKRKEIPPFGVLYMAAVLEANNIFVKIFKVDSENNILDLQDYDVIGFSISSSAAYGIIKKARMRSKISPNSLIAVGGIHSSLFPKETITDIQTDIVCIGESENTFLEIVRESSERRFESVKGICYLNKNKQTAFNAERELCTNLDSIPFPSRHLLPKSDIIMQDRLSDTNLTLAHIMISRGCVGKCYFCANTYSSIRYRSGRNVREELIMLKQKYNIEGFAITDDNFVIKKDNVKDVCTSIKNLGLKWSSLSRVDTVNEKILKIMADSGCIELKYGVESGSEKILNAMNKRINQESIISAIKLTKNQGINVKVFLIHGFPGENRCTTKDTILLLKKLRTYIDRVSLFNFVPLPGSYVYNNPSIYKIHGTNHSANWDGDWSKFHLYNNNNHWWGSLEDYKEMRESYKELKSFINDVWPVSLQEGNNG